MSNTTLHPTTVFAARPITILLIGAALVCLFFSSCRKADSDETEFTHIRGYVLEYGTEEPLEGVKMYLQEVGGEVLGSITFSTVDSFYTDDSGYFEYSFEDDYTSAFTYSFEEVPGYYDLGFRDVNNQKVNEHTHYADPFAWLELHLKNVNPIDGSDKIRFTHQYSPFSWQDIYGPADSTLVWQIKGNYESYLIWKVTKAGTTTEYRDTFAIPAHDTTYYQIQY